MKIALITNQVSFVKDFTSAAGGEYEAVPILFNNQSDVNVIMDDVLGTKTGSIEIEAVVIDDSFFASMRTSSEHVIDQCMGAGIPIFVRLQESDLPTAWKMASQGATLFSLERVREIFAEAFEKRKFNRDTLTIENEFANMYDEVELSSPATLSAILWENDYTVSQVKKYIQSLAAPVRILDLGCGTGRIEEILMTDPELEEKILSIDAVDFAPMYLKNAQERLAHFLPEKAMKRITFLRRIVEDTRLPENYYDVVIASFGVICFSQFHRTIPEIHRLLKPSGLVIMNGYNRNSLTYDFTSRSLFTVNIDRAKNEMHLGDKIFKCFTFHIDELEAFLNLVGLKPEAGTAQTFPTLYGCARKDYLDLLQPSNQSSRKGNQPASYQTIHLEKDSFDSGFLPVLHKMDIDLTNSLKDRGFYFALTATKQKR